MRNESIPEKVLEKDESRRGRLPRATFHYQNMTEALAAAVDGKLPRCRPVEIPKAVVSVLFLLTDEVPGDLAESTFRQLAELIVAAGLLADHQLAAVVAGVEPLRVGNNGRHSAVARAIEAGPGPEFDERPAL